MPTNIARAGDAGVTPGKKTNGTVAELMATPKDDWEFVTIPEEDALGNRHHGIGLNDQHWGPGTYQLPPPIAAHINSRLAIADKQTRRILLPQQDKAALAHMARRFPDAPAASA